MMQFFRDEVQSSQIVDCVPPYDQIQLNVCPVSRLEAGVRQCAPILTGSSRYMPLSIDRKWLCLG